MTVRVWLNAQLATLTADAADGWGWIADGAIVAEHGRIAWLGRRSELPQRWLDAESVDCAEAWLLPGLIDCHTHLVHAGNRSNEFEARLNGASYADISRAGGGIAATVRATREADDASLIAQSEKRLRRLIGEGVTTVEIKSGYGLNEADECKMLRVARALGAATPTRGAVRVRTTFLGAHALPPEFVGRSDDYVTEVCDRMLPAAQQQGLVDAVDAFCENVAFSSEQTRRVFNAAAALGLPVKLHADQLTDGAGAALAASAQALSADHLEHTSEASVVAMARAGTVAVLLPGAFYTLRDTQLPPIEALRKHGVPMAVATDCNPGTSPCTSPLLMLNMASSLFRLTPLEAVTGMTRHAAAALGIAGETGSLAVGMAADFSIWDIERPADLVYALGANPLISRVFAGEPDRSVST